MNRLYIFILLIHFTQSWATTISGFVKDSDTDKSIPNANIFIKETGQGTISNPYGYFEMEMIPGDYTLTTSVIGFETDTREIMVTDEVLELEVRLETTILEFSKIQVEGLFTTRLGYESVDVIYNEKIKSMEKESITDVLRTLPGVDVQFAHPNGRNVNLSIRGSSDYKPGGYNNRVLLLLDGFPIQIPNSGAPDWNSLPLESIQRIEVDNSPASAQYGHNSMGGVINLITDYKGKDKNTFLRFSGGTYSTGQTSITHGNEKGNWAYGVNAMTRSSEGHRFNADDKITRLRTYLRYGDNKGRTYRLSHILSYSDIGHPGFASIPSFRRSQRLSQYVQGHGFYPIGSGLSMSHSVFFNKFDTHYDDRNDAPEDKIEGERDYDDITVGFRSEMLVTKWARWIFMAGTDVNWSQSQVSVFNPIYDSPEQLSLGGFVQSKYSIGNGWNFGTGLRYDYRSSDPGGNFQKRIYTNWSPKVNLMYTMQGKRAFTLAYSEGFRAPSLSELYLKHTSSYGLTLQGNPSVLPEKVQAYEVMYEHPHSESWVWSVSVFHNRYENMIDFVYNVPVLAVNREGVTGTGSEYQFKWEPFDPININGSYAYLDMSDRSGDPILYRSRHRGQLYADFSSHILDVRLGVQGWTEQAYEDFLSHDYQFINGKIVFPLRKLPTTIISDLILSREIGMYRGSLRISNLFHMEYELIQDFPMPGRAWQFTLTKTL
ncbi:MAG: TonB-dependent receptor [Candidatus Marinimicrobia bacterium]|nr:TonB-dependent receptor [Candidatus Neomarinimicrobiota bacterium]